MNIKKYSDFKQEVVLFEGIEDISPVTIILPDPPNKNKVINYKKPTSAQKWERIKLPKEFSRFERLDKDLIHDSLKVFEHEIILDEYKKIQDGYWIYINGKLTWLTGTHYLYLNFWVPDFGRPMYKETDWKMFVHWNKVENDPLCHGLIEMTRRRQGKSARAGVIAYARTFTHKNRYCGIQSKTDDDASDFFQKTVVLPWKKLPFFLQPNYDSSNNPRYELRFYTPTRKGKESQLSLGADVSLESWIQVRASGETAFDGTKLHTSVDDEAGKTVVANVAKRWEIKKFCLEVDGEIIGKELMTTTVEEMDKMGGKYFKDIWDGSDPASSDKVTNQTISGLHRHFTPAYEGYIIDEFGNSNIEASIKELSAKRDSLKNKPAALTELKRRMPFTIKEAFRNNGKECPFNIEIIDSRLEHFTFGNPYVSYGNFKWKDNNQDSYVIFEKTNKENGKFIISYLFENPLEANKQIMMSGIKVPNNTTFGIAGGDPFKYKTTSGSVKSKGSGVVFMNHNMMIDPPDKDVLTWKTNKFICSYNNRTDDKREYGEDMLMMCVYYGIKMFPEINVDFLWDYFDERGYGGYLFYQRNSHHRISKTPGANTNDKTKDAIFTEFDSYINVHGPREVHPEILEAAREVDFDDLGPHDLFVASGYALLGAKKSFKLQPKSKSTNNQLFHTYLID